MAEETPDYVLKRWSDWRGRIEHLLATNERFREMCLDYEELADWIETRTESAAVRRENAIRILEELAVEIARFLPESEVDEPITKTAIEDRE